MSATRTEDATNAVSNQPGQVGSHVPPSEAMEKGGHKPGVLASERDRAPEFHAQTLPPGTAPKDKTYKPAPNDEVPNRVDYTDEGNDPEAVRTSASDTLSGATVGATSASVHTGLGKPLVGQSSVEERHDGQHGRKKQELGLAGVAAGGMQGEVNERDPGFAEQRLIDKEVGELKGAAGERGNVSAPNAEDRLPETAETVASEHHRG